MNAFRKLGLPLVVPHAAGNYSPPPWASCHTGKEIRNGRPSLGFIDLVNIIDEQRGAADTSQFVEKLVLRHRTTDDMRHLKPAARNNSIVSEHNDPTFGLKTFGEMLHDRRLANTWTSDDVQNPALLQLDVSLIDQLGPGQSHAAHVILDGAECAAFSFRQSSIDQT